MASPQWKIDMTTIRDCPGNRTEMEWRDAVRALETSLLPKAKTCHACGAHAIPHQHKYAIHETHHWMPSDCGLPRGRWQVQAHATTLRAARRIQKFMGPKARIWMCIRRDANGATYQPLKEKKR